MDLSSFVNTKILITSVLLGNSVCVADNLRHTIFLVCVRSPQTLGDFPRGVNFDGKSN